MKALLLMVSALALAGCGTPTTNLVVQSEVRQLCEAGAAKYASLRAPTKTQQGAKKVMDLICANPEASGDAIVAVYRIIAANR